MTKNKYFQDPSVSQFCTWLTSTLPQLKICLNIKPSRFVPSGLHAVCNGINQILGHYKWCTSAVPSGDWPNTKVYLTTLSQGLQKAVASGNQPNTLQVCHDVLVWGGNRNWGTGAWPFLQKMASAGNLCQYLSNTGTALKLTTANTGTLAPPVSSMYSMLSKVHAVNATDGLPIYDSRVAAAIASLVELWRDSAGISQTPLPPSLSFQAIPSGNRSVLNLFPGAQNPGKLSYPNHQTPALWAGAMVRLGWLMECVLQSNPSILSQCCANPTLAGRMHALEAALFMIGYDVTCLNCALGGQQKAKVQ